MANYTSHQQSRKYPGNSCNGRIAAGRNGVTGGERPATLRGEISGGRPTPGAVSVVVRGILDIDPGNRRILLQALLQSRDVRVIGVIDLVLNLAQLRAQRHALGERRRRYARQLAAGGPDLQADRVRRSGV